MARRYPNLPYTYDDCIQSILALDLGEEFNRAVFFENARRLLGLQAGGERLEQA